MAKRSPEELYYDTEVAYEKFKKGKELTLSEMSLLKRMHDTFTRLNSIFKPSITLTIKNQNTRIAEAASDH